MLMNACRSVVLSALLPFAIGFPGGAVHAQSADLIRQLQDRAEIEELVVRYVTVLDTRDADMCAQTLRAAENGQFIVGFMGRYEDVIVKRNSRRQILSRRLASFVR